MNIYDVTSVKQKFYTRSIFIDGQRIVVKVTGNVGTIEAVNPVSDETMRKLERFYNVVHVQKVAEPVETAEVIEETSTTVDEGQEEENVTEEPEQEEELVVEEEEVVEEPHDDQHEIPTGEEIQSMYENLGTWSAVASHYDVSTSTLRKWREMRELI